MTPNNDDMKSETKIGGVLAHSESEQGCRFCWKEKNFFWYVNQVDPWTKILALTAFQNDEPFAEKLRK